MKKPQAIEIIADGARGQYVPQHFAEACAHWDNFSDADRAILLAGPGQIGDDPGFGYWDTWCIVLDNATYTDGGHTWRLHPGESGDLFAVCDELMTDDKYLEFYGEERNP
tara:strand:+ start:358 stop:687 length:330 start_codon:yes stop_codon:yes gene_type:complete